MEYLALFLFACQVALNVYFYIQVRKMRELHQSQFRIMQLMARVVGARR